MRKSVVKSWNRKILVSAFLLVSGVSYTRADIYEWALSNGIVTQSTTVCPGGSGVSAVPNADLSNLDLTQAYLIQADLTSATLTDADLTNANVSSGVLTNACLSGCILTNSNLTGAIVAGCNVGLTNITASNSIHRELSS